MRTFAIVVLLSGVGIAASACYAYRPVAVAPVAGSRVRVVLTTAMPVAAMTPGREEARRSYAGVLEATGWIVAAAGDTVAIRLGELRTTAGSVPDVDGLVAVIPAAQIARMEERRFQAGTTLLAGVGLSMLALGTFVILITVTLTRGI